MSAPAAAAPIAVLRPLPPEEAGRANLYALLARMIHAAPDGALLHRIAQSPPLEPGADAALARAWGQLVAASSAMDGDAAGDEHDALFATIGKPTVSRYAGYYIGATAVDHPRVRLRADLAALGLAPRPEATEPEDQFGYLFEAMRVLVAGGAGRGPATLDEQRRFFEAHVAAAAPKFFAALGSAEASNYYRKIAALGAAFMALEAQSFSLD
ncbi:MAG TPA: molecular chaperone TorD family protein [Usitatibacter sp.]|nr:molecular chaperone TorD family protein [Usitatibacter sp.]